MNIKYPIWLSDIIEREFKNCELDAAEDERYLTYMHEHAHLFADAFWCSCAGTGNALAIQHLLLLRAKILRSIKRDATRLQWQMRSNIIHPCKPSQCAYAWCCVRALTDKPIEPTFRDNYY